MLLLCPCGGGVGSVSGAVVKRCQSAMSHLRSAWRASANRNFEDDADAAQHRDKRGDRLSARHSHGECDFEFAAICAN